MKIHLLDMTNLRWALLWLAVSATVWPVLGGRDEIAADAIWQAAIDEAGDDLGASIYVDAARVNAAVLPWQPGWRRARERVRWVSHARRDRLQHDRGGTRSPHTSP
jgi:hypothetical protein